MHPNEALSTPDGGERRLSTLQGSRLSAHTLVDTDNWKTRTRALKFTQVGHTEKDCRDIKRNSRGGLAWRVPCIVVGTK